jgi:HK97 family phage portal protein
MTWWRRLLGIEGRSTVYPGVHPRDPALATLWGYGGETAASVSVTPDNAMRAPAVAASVRLLSETIATIPLDLFELDANGERERATAQPLHAIVHDAPNEWLSSTDWRRRMMNGVLLRGNQYNRIYWAGDGSVRSIEPLPKTVTPKRANGRVYYTVYQDGQSYTLPAIEVLHIRGPFQSEDKIEADSPVVIGRELIARSIASGEYISRFFANNAVPKAAIKIPADVGEESAKKLRKDFEARHKGLENAHRLVIVPGGMELTTLGSTNEEAQTLDLYKQSALEIASRLYGIPPHLSGDIEKQTSWGAGIEQMDIGYVKHVVRPYLVGIEQALGMALLTAEQRSRCKFEFNVEGLLRGDFKSRMEGYALLIQWGMATINEVRRRENLPPIPGGDVRMMPLNYAPADRIMDVLLKEPAKAMRAMADLLIEMREPDAMMKEHGHA